MPPDDASVSPSPPPIPDYQLLRRIGRGSYGDVWLARSATGLYRAVKIVWRARFGDDGAPYDREFNGLREFARITAGETQQLSLLHVGRNDRQGFFYYVMELADDVVTGREIDPNCYEPLTFRTYRETRQALSIRDVVQHAIELARGLAELHSTGHIHRDIKPSNIIVVHGRPKLADIGLIAHSSDALTFVGTEGFMPPEGPGTTAADIYSFGKVLYELATGRDRHDFPRLPEDFGAREDHGELLELNEIFLRACAPLPAERYPDVQTLLSDLQLLEAGRSVRRLRRAEAGLAHARKWVIAAAAIALVAGTGAYLERQRADIETTARRAAEQQLAAVTRRSLYESSIANAQRALTYDEFGLARDALATSVPRPGEPDLRGFEWYALEREAQGDPAVVFRDHGPRVDRIVLSPDHRLAAIDDASTNVEIYDIATARLVTTIPGIHRLAGFTPDGKRLAGTTPQYELETWSIADGSPDPRPNQPGIHRPIAVAASSPRLLYYEDSLGDAPHRFAIQNLDTGEDELSWTVPHRQGALTWDYHKAVADAELHHIAFLAVHGSMDSFQFHLYHWSIEADQLRLVSAEDSPENYALLSLSADGTRWLRGINGEEPQLWVDGQPHQRWSETLSPGPEMINTLSPDGRLTLLGTRYRECIVADAATGKPIVSLLGHSQVPNAFAWLPDSNTFLSGSRQGDIRLWSATTHPTQPTVVATAQASKLASASCILPELDGPLALVPCTTQLNFLYNSADGSLRQTREDIQVGLLLEAGRLWWITPERMIVSAPVDGNTPADTLPILDPGERVREASVSPDGRWIAASDSARHIYLWDRTAQTVVGRMKTAHSTSGLAVDNLGHVIFVDYAQKLQKWSLTGDTPQPLLERHHAARSPKILVSPDNRWLVLFGATDDTVVVRNDDFRRALLLDNTYAQVGAIAFDPSSHMIAYVGPRGSVRIFRLSDRDHWEEQPPLLFNALTDKPSRSAIERLGFSADGNSLYAHSFDGTLRIWHK